MTRTYILNADLANKVCDILKHHSYYDVAPILNEFARQDAEYDVLEKKKEVARDLKEQDSRQLELPLEAPKKRRSRKVK